MHRAHRAFPGKEQRKDVKMFPVRIPELQKQTHPPLRVPLQGGEFLEHICDEGESFECPLLPSFELRGVFRVVSGKNAGTTGIWAVLNSLINILILAFFIFTVFRMIMLSELCLSNEQERCLRPELLRQRILFS